MKGLSVPGQKVDQNLQIEKKFKSGFNNYKQ